MNNANLTKWHFAAIKMILSIDEPILPDEKIHRLKNYSDALILTWSVDLMKFYLQAILQTCKIIKLLCNTEGKK